MDTVNVHGERQARCLVASFRPVCLADGLNLIFSVLLMLILPICASNRPKECRRRVSRCVYGTYCDLTVSSISEASCCPSQNELISLLDLEAPLFIFCVGCSPLQRRKMAGVAGISLTAVAELPAKADPRPGSGLHRLRRSPTARSTYVR